MSIIGKIKCHFRKAHDYGRKFRRDGEWFQICETCGKAKIAKEPKQRKSKDGATE